MPCVSGSSVEPGECIGQREKRVWSFTKTLFAQKQGLFEGNETLGPGDPDARPRPSDLRAPAESPCSGSRLSERRRHRLFRARSFQLPRQGLHTAWCRPSQCFPFGTRVPAAVVSYSEVRLGGTGHYMPRPRPDGKAARRHPVRAGEAGCGEVSRGWRRRSGRGSHSQVTRGRAGNLAKLRARPGGPPPRAVRAALRHRWQTPGLQRVTAACAQGELEALGYQHPSEQPSADDT